MDDKTNYYNLVDTILFYIEGLTNLEFDNAAHRAEIRVGLYRLLKYGNIT